MEILQLIALEHFYHLLDTSYPLSGYAIATLAIGTVCCAFGFRSAFFPWLFRLIGVCMLLASINPIGFYAFEDVYDAPYMFDDWVDQYRHYGSEIMKAFDKVEGSTPSVDGTDTYQSEGDYERPSYRIEFQ